MDLKTFKENDFKISPNKTFLISNRIQCLHISLWLFQISSTREQLTRSMLLKATANFAFFHIPFDFVYM